MEEIITYLKSFLLYGDTESTKYVGYTADASLWSQYKVVIVPNGHLGRDLILPDMAHPIVEKIGNTHIIQTDIIYNTFFFISRAEELLNPQRDEHGRFLAKHSILGDGNNLEIPIIDEYARLLLKFLDMSLPTPQYGAIYLTHDIDTLAHYRHLRGALGGIMRGQWRDVLLSLQDIRHDPAYTFPWLIEQDLRVPHARIIYFVKDTHGKGYDYPQYHLKGHDYQQLKINLITHGAHIGWHSSYYGAQGNTLSHLTIDERKIHRSHYLNCSIDTMQYLVDQGVTDDFTMAFPDQAGFRLQTTRSVRWINPKTMILTPLTLHPITIMDCTLSNANYMNIKTEDEAYFFCEQLLDRVRRHHGEVVLLWHNNRFTDDTYHASLYSKILKGLRHYSHQIN